MAGLLKAGSGNREAEGEELILREEEERLTSLLGGRVLGEAEKLGESEAALEKAAEEALDWETAEEPGREGGARLESREVDRLLDRRRSRPLCWAWPVLGRPFAADPAGRVSAAMGRLTRGSLCLFIGGPAFSETDRVMRGTWKGARRGWWSGVPKVYMEYGSGDDRVNTVEEGRGAAVVVVVVLMSRSGMSARVGGL